MLAGEEPDDPAQTAIRAELPEVCPVPQGLSVRRDDPPSEADEAVVRVDGAGYDDARPRPQLRELSCMMGESLAALEMDGWVGICAVIGPRMFQQRLPGRLIRLVPGVHVRPDRRSRLSVSKTPP
jgi:hypothetical protein